MGEKAIFTCVATGGLVFITLAVVLTITGMTSPDKRADISTFANTDQVGQTHIDLDLTIDFDK